MDKTPLVSAIVSTYNSESFIEGCLKNLLSQSIAETLEIVVVDSASQQAEGEIVRGFQDRYNNIKYIKTEVRETVYAAWNRGIRLSSGKYITNANTDDRHSKHALEIMASALEAMPHISLVYADVILTYSSDDTFEKYLKDEALLLRWDDWDRLLLFQKCFIGPQPMWRRDVHRLYGYFDSSLISSGDYEFWLRISQTLDFFHIPQVLGLYLSRHDSVEKGNKLRDEEDKTIQSMYIESAKAGRIIRCPGLRETIRLISNKVSNGTVDTDSVLKTLSDTIGCSGEEALHRLSSINSQTLSDEQIYRILCSQILSRKHWHRRFMNLLNPNNEKPQSSQR